MPHGPSSPAANRLVAVPPPPIPIFRVARGLDPFAPPPWDFAHEDGTFGNRFDDPSGRRGKPPEACFRAIYCATQRAGAFGETLARFRPSLSLLADLREVNDDGGSEEPSQTVIIPKEWRTRRRLSRTVLDASLRFVDLAAAETVQHLRIALAPTARSLGLEEFDISTVTGPHRMLTQEVARYIYEQIDADGHSRFAGIRYLSRLNLAWECWAIFDTRMRHLAAVPETIAPDDPGLIEAARLFHFNIEVADGHDL